MRDPRELLSTLTAEVQGYEIVDGAIPEYLPSDLAHAMGFIKDKDAALLIGVKYCGRSEDIHALDLRFWMLVIDNYGNWTRTKGYKRGSEFIRRLSQMAINEYMDDHRCPACLGTSEKMKEDLRLAFHKDFVFCETCNDLGKVFPRETDRARLAKMDQGLWDKVWAYKYRQIQSLIHDLERKACEDLEDALACVNTA